MKKNARMKRAEAKKKEKQSLEKMDMDQQSKSALEGIDVSSLERALDRGAEDDQEARIHDEGRIGWELPIGHEVWLTGHKLRHLPAGYCMLAMSMGLWSLNLALRSPEWSVTEAEIVSKDYTQPWSLTAATRTYGCTGFGPLYSEYGTTSVPIYQRSHPYEGPQGNSQGVCTEYNLFPECTSSINSMLFLVSLAVLAAFAPVWSCACRSQAI